MYRKPRYPIDQDFTTNAPTYYDDLARKNELIKYLAKRVWEYDKELYKRFEQWDGNLETLPDDLRRMLVDWMDDGTLEKIINEEIFKDLNEKIDRESTERKNDIADVQEDIQELGFDVQEGIQELSSDVQALPTEILEKPYTMKRSATLNPIIVAYGDSNTRFYLGDNGTVGAIAHSFPSVIDRELVNYPNYYGSEVINAGYPSRTSQFGLDNYSGNIVYNNANIAIIGFGTNDIRIDPNGLDTYLSNMEGIIDRCLNDDVVPIVLGIPYFTYDYAPQSYDQLPVWNQALMELCIEKNVKFIDVYNMFTEKHVSVWFNESGTRKRHYSTFANRTLGELLVKEIVSMDAVNSYKSEFIQEIFTFPMIDWFDYYSNTVRIVSYMLGTQSINTVHIPEGARVEMKLMGRYVLGFYPRENAKVNVSTLGTFDIQAKMDGGVYYPIQKVANTSKIITAHATAPDAVVITAVEGDVYLSYIGSEWKVRNINVGVNRVSVNASDLPSNPNFGDKYAVNELRKEVRWTGIQGVGKWVDHSGYIAVGNTSDRTSVENDVPKGFKFYRTTDNTMYRSDGNGGWTTS